MQDLVVLLFNRKPFADHASLVHHLPNDSCGSATRSTLPLIDYWRNPYDRVAELSKLLPLQLKFPIELHFEYSVPVASGSGKASFTDLIVIAADSAVAIEAKFTEPHYEDVEQWSRNPPEANRLDVLKGWLTYIERATSRRLEIAQVRRLPYQLIHRTPSVCSIDRPQRAVVYKIFGAESIDYYRGALSALRMIIDEPNLTFHVVTCSLEPLKVHGEISRMLKKDSPEIRAAIRNALGTGPLFTFGVPIAHAIEG